MVGSVLVSLEVVQKRVKRSSQYPPLMDLALKSTQGLKWKGRVGTMTENGVRSCEVVSQDKWVPPKKNEEHQTRSGCKVNQGSKDPGGNITR